MFLALLSVVLCSTPKAPLVDSDEAEMTRSIEGDLEAIKNIPSHVKLHGQRYWKKQDNRQLSYGRRLEGWDEELKENLEQVKEEEGEQ